MRRAREVPAEISAAVDFACHPFVRLAQRGQAQELAACSAVPLRLINKAIKLAAANDWVASVQVLLVLKADVGPALNCAARYGSLASLHRLLAIPLSDVPAENVQAFVECHNPSVLRNAAKRGHVDVVRAMLRAKVQPDTCGSAGTRTPLAAAANSVNPKYVETVRVLLAAKADTVGRTPNRSPLFFALLRRGGVGKAAVVRCLLAAKSDLCLSQNRTLLRTALLNNYGPELNGPEGPGVILTLLQAKVHVEPGILVSALRYVPVGVQTMRHLLAHKASANYCQYNEYTLLKASSPLSVLLSVWRCPDYFVDCIRLLAAEKANVDLVVGQAPKFSTLLMRSVEVSSLSATRALLQAKCSINYVGGDGSTALSLAIAECSAPNDDALEIVRLLVDARASLNSTAQNCPEISPLRQAKALQSRACARLLMQAKARP